MYDSNNEFGFCDGARASRTSRSAAAVSDSRLPAAKPSRGRSAVAIAQDAMDRSWSPRSPGAAARRATAGGKRPADSSRMDAWASDHMTLASAGAGQARCPPPRAPAAAAAETTARAPRTEAGSGAAPAGPPSGSGASDLASAQARPAAQWPSLWCKYHMLSHYIIVMLCIVL